MLSGWLFWSLAAALTLGVGQVAAKKGLSYFSPLAYNIFSTLIELPIFLPFALWLGLDLPRFKVFDFLILIFIASTYLIFFYVISLGEISLTGTVLASYPLSTIFFSTIFLGEKLSLPQLFFALIIIAGVGLIGFPRKLLDLRSEKWFWLAVFSAILVGFSDFLAKYVLGRVGEGNYFFFYPFAFIPGLFLSLLLDRKGRYLPQVKPRLWLWALTGVTLEILGGLFFFLALARGPASLAGPVSSSYAAITVILALFFLGEKMSKIQAVGVTLTVLGIILIGLW